LNGPEQIEKSFCRICQAFRGMRITVDDGRIVDVRGAKEDPDADLRRGVMAVGHGWPGLKSRPWEASNALVDADEGAQSINRMPIMTGFVVEVRASNLNVADLLPGLNSSRI
jgi:hypothetical protein